MQTDRWLTVHHWWRGCTHGWDSRHWPRCQWLASAGRTVRTTDSEREWLSAYQHCRAGSPSQRHSEATCWAYRRRKPDHRTRRSQAKSGRPRTRWDDDRPARTSAGSRPASPRWRRWSSGRRSWRISVPWLQRYSHAAARHSARDATAVEQYSAPGSDEVQSHQNNRPVPCFQFYSVLNDLQITHSRSGLQLFSNTATKPHTDLCHDVWWRTRETAFISSKSTVDS